MVNRKTWGATVPPQTPLPTAGKYLQSWAVGRPVLCVLAPPRAGFDRKKIAGFHHTHTLPWILPAAVSSAPNTVVSTANHQPLSENVVTFERTEKQKKTGSLESALPPTWYVAPLKTPLFQHWMHHRQQAGNNMTMSWPQQTLFFPGLCTNHQCVAVMPPGKGGLYTSSVATQHALCTKDTLLQKNCSQELVYRSGI